MEINQWVECPYCGTKIAVYNEVNSTFYTVRKVVTCDIDAGGCDRLFVVGYTLTVEVSTLKIEGEQAKHGADDAYEHELEIGIFSE